VIIHRTREKVICRTPVMVNAQGKYSVERATWSSVTGQKCDDMKALIQALKTFNMVYIT
jgi:hypothetical protein